ncbi:UNVERIFIED_CONTAM: Two-component response regulator 24 [Sesamum latifolium]|uniref:Two-component response regulator 24 n=1 Tax=Sesamum latifolium TaxID=2727402 RepID=A0AAW2WKT9_9LAMI
MVPWFYLAGKMVIGSSKKVVAEQIEEVRRICALVVDDDPLVRRIHGMLLARYGLETEGAENGKEAVDLFLAGKTFDLVLMDMEMPVMDGLQATQRLRGMGVSSMIVGVTARGLEAEKEAFMATGLDACCVKPLNAEAVISVLDELAKKLL